MLLFYIIILLFLLIFSLAFITIILFQIIDVFTVDAPFVPVPKEVENQIIENLGLTNDSVLYDLGCGDGRILITAIKKFPHIKVIGVEKGLFPYCVAKWKTRKFKNIKIKREDIFETDISNATHIFTYLYPEVINQLIERIQSNVVFASVDFQLEKISPTKVIDLKNSNSKRGKKLFIYHLTTL